MKIRLDTAIYCLFPVSIIALASSRILRQLEDWPTIQFAALVLVIILLLSAVRSRRYSYIDPVAILMVIMGLLGIAFSLFVIDQQRALLHWLGFLNIVIVSLELGRLCSEKGFLENILRASVIAYSFLFLLAIFVVVTEGLNALQRGRLSFIGHNPNQSAFWLISAGPVFAYSFVKTTSVIIRNCSFAAFVFVLFFAFGASRQAFLGILVGIAPILFYRQTSLRLFNHLLVLVFISIVFAGQMIIEAWGLINLERQLSIVSGVGSRAELFLGKWADYSERLILGVVEQPGMYLNFDPGVGGHPHNAFLFLLHYGGLTLLGPFLVILAVSYYRFVNLFVYARKSGLELTAEARLLLGLLLSFTLVCFSTQRPMFPSFEGMIWFFLALVVYSNSWKSSMKNILLQHPAAR